jgi:hypothetical protein
MYRVTEQNTDDRCTVVNVSTMVLPQGQTAEGQRQGEERNEA